MEIKEIKEELLFDFSVRIPRVLVGGRIAVIDNVKKIVMLSDTEIVIANGSGFVSVRGEDLIIRVLEEERIKIAGIFKNVEFLDSQG